jgi:septal ring factor EnvC (AmiA/AmiB activator)
MNPFKKSDAEVALHNAQTVVRSALLQIIEVDHTLRIKLEMLDSLQPFLAKLDRLTLLEGADVSTLRRDAKNAEKQIDRAIKQLSAITSSLDALEGDLNVRNFGPIPHLGLAAATLP